MPQTNYSLFANDEIGKLDFMKNAVMLLSILLVFGCAPTQNNSNHGVQQLANSCKNNKLSDRFFCSTTGEKNIKFIFQSNCDFHEIISDPNNTSDPAVYLKGQWSLNDIKLSYTLNGEKNDFTLIWSADDQSFTALENQLVYSRCN